MPPPPHDLAHPSGTLFPFISHGGLHLVITEILLLFVYFLSPPPKKTPVVRAETTAFRMTDGTSQRLVEKLTNARVILGVSHPRSSSDYGAKALPWP